jgi:predicted GNAT family acetyltransferase
MTVNKYATAAGKKYQRDVMKHLREQGFDAENLVLTGAEDEGDILMRRDPYLNTKSLPDRFVIEAKREKGFHLADWTKQARVEADNYAKHRDLLTLPGFMVVHHARGKGLGQSYVTTTLEEFLSWL